MKTLKLFVISFLVLVLMSSCSLSFRDYEQTESYVITPSEATSQAPLSPGTDNATTNLEADLSTYPSESTEATEVVSESVTATEAASATEAPVIDIPEPPAGTYKPKALMYHLILDEVYGPYENLFVRPSEFDTHLSVLDELGYEYLFAEEWRLTEKPSVMITLDDGYEDNYTEMFPILKAHGAKATVFLVTDLIGTDGYMTREMIREMSASGYVSFQCHTAHHSDLSYQSSEALRADFDESCSIIEEITGKPVRALAYPAGSYNNTVLDVAKDYFDFAYTTKSPNSVTEYTPLTVPRHYIARGYGRELFSGFVHY